MSAALGFEIRTAQLSPETYVVSISGEVDMYASPALEQELRWVLGDGGKYAIVDMAEVTFIDSTTLTVLLKVLPSFKRRQGELILVSDDRRVLRTLEITGLGAKFDVVERLADATARFVSLRSVPHPEPEGRPLEGG